MLPLPPPRDESAKLSLEGEGHAQGNVRLNSLAGLGLQYGHRLRKELLALLEQVTHFVEQPQAWRGSSYLCHLALRDSLQKFDFPDVPSRFCHLDVVVSPGEKLKAGDLCYAPGLNQLMRLKKTRPNIDLHKVVTVSCPSELAVKRLPDLIFMKNAFDSSPASWQDQHAS